jgi:hypothetical protein
MRYFHTPGGQMRRRWLSRTLQKAAVSTSLATTRFASVEIKHSKMGCSTSRSTHAASTSRTRLSSLWLYSPCSAGTKTRPSATYTCLTYRQERGKLAICPRSSLGSQPSVQVDGSRAAGHFKSFLHQASSSSTLNSGRCLVTRCR